MSLLHDPYQAMESIRSGGFHIAILDLEMPQMNGLELLAQVRHVDKDLAVIILTGHPSVDTASSSIEYDISAYVQKPFSIPNIVQHLERIAKTKGLTKNSEQELHKSIGRKIREFRKSQGLTLKELSRRTALSVSLLSQIERAESSASVSSLFKVANALRVGIRDLIGQY